MKITTLGCSGGIGGQQNQTTAFLIDDDILLDCGTGVGSLSLEAMAAVDHVFLTHAHFDHIACLPMLIDSTHDIRKRALTVHATVQTLQALHDCIFNWRIWPDFREIPDRKSPRLQFSPVHTGEAIVLNRRRIVPLPVQHTVPATGYLIDSGNASLAFSGDTGICSAFWQALNALSNLHVLIIESAFPNSERKLAELSQHLCPSILAEELTHLQHNPEIYITHIKPGQTEVTMAEIRQIAGGRMLHLLQPGKSFML